MDRLKRLSWMLTRRKPMDVSEEAPTDLDRCLNTLDLTALGVGATLGLGLYILSGEVAALKAGPGVVLSFMIAAVASTFSALCYAEFAAKVPKSGSAYAYSYITVGEFVAFVIGWNLTLEHVIGTASLARGYSGYLGSLFQSVPIDMILPLNASSPAVGLGASTTTSSPLRSNNVTSHANSTRAHDICWGFDEFNECTMSASLWHQFDFVAFGLTGLVTGLLLLGVQVSSKFQITFASLNLCVVCFIIVCGLFKIDFHNWNLTPEEMPPGRNVGAGGFLPFGFTGVIQGAGTCFFAFVGFDGIAATAEEVKNPRKAIPRSILWTSGIIFVTYCAMSTIQTLIWPYWDQKQAAPLPYIFDKLGMPFAKWTVLVGVLAGLSTSFVGGFLPLPRIMYAMARDGVIYRSLSIVSKRFKVPYVATLVGGLLIAFLASTLDIDQLADMLSIGTLAAYSLVSISVLLLRYEYRPPTESDNPLPLSCKLNHEGQLMTELGIETKLATALTPAPMSCDPNNNNNNSTNGTGNNNGNGNSKLSYTPKDSSAILQNGLAKNGHGELANANGKACKSSPEVVPRSLWQVFCEGTKQPDGVTVRLPDAQTTHISRVMILTLVLVTTVFDYAMVVWGPTLYLLEPVATSVSLFLFGLTIFLTYLLNRLPTAEPSTTSFEVPLVPTIPLFSVVINSFLMLNLSVTTWIRFAVWMSMGFYIYFSYGIFNSTGYKDSRCD